MKQNVIILDWSNLIFRSLFSINNFGQKFLTFHEKEETDSLIAKVATDVAFLLRIFNSDKVLFAADSKHSWRKDILKTYKSSRVRDDKLDWENIFQALDDFKEHLKSKGYIFLETEHAEADDLMALVKEIIFEDVEFINCNLIIVSADADIRQLIDWKDLSKQYCMVFNEIGRGPGGKRHLYCNKEIMNWYKSESTTPADIFNFTAIDSEKMYIKKILENNKKIVLEETDPKNILLSKIFCGDDGDDVPAFYDWYNNKGKKIRITNSKFVKILEKLNAKDINEIVSKKRQLKPVLESVCKRQINDIDVEDRLSRQQKLVQLSSEKFPEAIRNYKMEIKELLKKQNNIKCFGISMKDLVSGSQFETVIKEKKAKDADIFKGLNKYIDNINLTELF